MDREGTSHATRRLREAFNGGRLTLYLGAGVSTASEVPSWRQLVTELYMNGIGRHLHRFDSVPELVPSVSSWIFDQQDLPLEVAARRLRGYYKTDDDLMVIMRAMLYDRTGCRDRGRLHPAEIRALLDGNHTLRAVSRLCRRSVLGKHGVRAVVTYNYDDLLEKSLGRFPFQSVWRAVRLKPRTLPILHVHGFVPARPTTNLGLDDVVLTEDQYNRASHDPYSWQNLVQIHTLSGSIGLMVGLSLTDRNMRSLLDALRSLPQRVEAYALLQRPTARKLKPDDVDCVAGAMKTRIRQRFGPHAEPQADAPGVRDKILAMVRAIDRHDLVQDEAVLTQLGVRPIWYDEHDEIEGFVAGILRGR